MRFRKLRIAWSVFWGVVAVLIAASIYWEYVLEQAGFYAPYEPNPTPDYQTYARASIVPVAIALLAAVPWMPLRFSLRTLLIATTLVAVVLGLIVAVLRWSAG